MIIDSTVVLINFEMVGDSSSVAVNNARLKPHRMLKRAKSSDDLINLVESPLDFGQESFTRIVLASR